MTLQTGRLRTMEQTLAFVEGCESVDSKLKDRACAYAFVRRTPVRFDSARLGCADRGCVRAYIGKVCGFSPAQITRLVRQPAGTGAMEDRRARNSGRAFGRVCTPADIRLVAEVDEAFGALSGLATCELPRFRGGRLCAARSRSTATGASNGWRGSSHVYHLRAPRTYRMKWSRSSAGTRAQRSIDAKAGLDQGECSTPGIGRRVGATYRPAEVEENPGA